MTIYTEAVKNLSEIIAATSLNYAPNKVAAQEILAAIQADPLAYVKPNPIVWIERRNMTWDAKGLDYKIISNRDGTWRVRRNGKIIFARQKSFEAAEDRTNEHLCNFMKGLF